MRIEDMDFRPRKLFPAAMCLFVVLLFGTFGTIFAVNIYREVLRPTTRLDLWGWIGGGAITYALTLLLLHVTTLPWRISFTEEGVRVLGLSGRRLVAWSSVRAAHISTYKGDVSFALRTGRVSGVTIPLGSYRRPAALVAEVSKRLPVPVNAAPAVLATLKDEDATA